MKYILTQKEFDNLVSKDSLEIKIKIEALEVARRIIVELVGQKCGSDCRSCPIHLSRFGSYSDDITTAVATSEEICKLDREYGI